METFKNIIDYENLYQISNLDNIKNLKTNRILKNIKHSDGYFCISLFKDKKPKSFLIHRLVGIHFIPNPNNYSIINHIDTIKTNNCVDNLEWVNNRENISHGYKLKNKSSKYPGVSLHKQSNKWKAGVHINGKEKHIGYYLTEELAAQAYNEYLIANNIVNKYSKNT